MATIARGARTTTEGWLRKEMATFVRLRSPLRRGRTLLPQTFLKDKPTRQAPPGICGAHERTMRHKLPETRHGNGWFAKTENGLVNQIKMTNFAIDPAECGGGKLDSISGITWTDLNDFWEPMFEPSAMAESKKIRYSERVVGDDGRIYFYEDGRLVFHCSPETEARIRQWGEKE